VGKLLYTGLAVLGVGMANTPAQAATTVDTAPLIIQASLPPNIVLMLDDSGSMAWDVMPDYGFLADTSGQGLANSAINGLYYNPTISYSAPPKADGSFYPNASFSSAWINGFNQGLGTVDISSYDGSSDSSINGNNNSSIPYSKKFTKTTTTNNTYSPTLTCSNGGTLQTSGANAGKCVRTKNGKTTVTDPTPTCNGNDPYNSSTKMCTSTTTTTTTAWLFTYTVGPQGSYTQYYVGKTGGCAVASLSAPICTEDTTVQQNVANWFSYYHTRILMAKSGLMSAFLGINPNYRVGFGSIDGGGNGNSNYRNLPSSRYSYSDSYNGGTNYIAQVQPFGDGTSTSTSPQKAAFWTWVSAAQANGGTPLRQALNAVGTYYQQSQPWTTMASDPDPTATTELACRQSYTILTTDGFWNDSFSGAGNVDGQNGATITGPNAQSGGYKAAAPYSDSNSNTLADVALKYWETDLRPSTANEVPVSTEDSAFWQHMTTFTLGLGFTPTGIKPAGTTVDQIFAWANGGTAISGFSWPTPSGANNGSILNISDLAHAAVNGHGGFYSATSPQAFSSGLKDALKRATERVGTGASLAANSTQLQTGTVAYQANYYTAKWKGDLKALAINSATGAISTTPSWTASQVLPTAANRTIYTYNPTATTNGYVAFQVKNGTLPSLSSAQLSALGTSATDQANMINYLRGDATLTQANNGPYRNRDTPLGDIVNSQPIFVGAPDPNQYTGQTFSGTTTFAAYASGKAQRTGLIYVAANDGMLHAFNASTGVEAYAYLPGAVIANGGAQNLASLASPDYGSDSLPHQFFNDGELTVADVYMSSSWETVLVGTTGRGLAKAVYALDVTDPSNIKFLWERSAGDGNSDGNSKYIGQMTGKPVIAQTADGTWSVLMGNGYNSAGGNSTLLQFGLASGALTVHTTSGTSGLAAPGVWINSPGTGVSAVAYAGDLGGNVYSFGLNTGTTATTATPSSGGTLLYTAKDGGNKAQPITSGLLVGRDAQSGNVWVFFGTGKYLSATDLSNTSTQTWYGLIVQSTNATDSPVAASSMSRTNLAERDITSETSTSTSPARTITAAADASSQTGKSGWYIDLLSPTGASNADVQQGERMVTPNQFQGNLLLGTTRIPIATDACNPSGSGWIMAVDPFTGTAPTTNFFDINGDGKVDGNDGVGGKPAAGIGFSSLPNNPIFVGGSMLVSFDNGTNSSIQTSSSTGGLNRVSWRELITP
jgi:type IV pilus assembly protein PilY1